MIVARGNLLSGPCFAQRVSKATISDKNCETRTLCPFIQCWLQVYLFTLSQHSQILLIRKVTFVDMNLDEEILFF